MPIDFFLAKPVANQDLLMKNKERKSSDPNPISELPSQPVVGITKTPGHSYRWGWETPESPSFRAIPLH